MPTPSLTDETLLETLNALNAFGGDQSKAAGYLGIARQTLQHRLRVAAARQIYIAPEKLPPAAGPSHIQQFLTDERGEFSFLAAGDFHIGSKYHRADVMNALHNEAAERGITAAFDTGNWIDGEASFNKTDLAVHGLGPQIRELAQTYPNRLTTYAVAGDDHEGWYSKREGLDIGRLAEDEFRHLGRTDWKSLGYMESFVEVVHPSSRKSTKILLMHPGGGSAYAVSYRPQKIVESFEGGEKPGVVLIGHYHKLSLNLVRNVWAIQTGCAQDQTPFMRKKGIDAHIGGVFVTIKLEEKTGNVVSCTATIRRFHNRSAINNRWSPSDQPDLPRREL